MKQRGRKSADKQSLRVVPDVIPQRPQAPRDMSKEERAVWKQAVNRMPATHFTDEMLPMLELYCFHVVQANDLMGRIREVKADSARLAKELSRVEAQSAREIRRLMRINEDYLHTLLQQHMEQSDQVASIATKLRLTPQSRYTPTNAAATAEVAPRRKLPWET